MQLPMSQLANRDEVERSPFIHLISDATGTPQTRHLPKPSFLVAGANALAAPQKLISRYEEIVCSMYLFCTIRSRRPTDI